MIRNVIVYNYLGKRASVRYKRDRCSKKLLLAYLKVQIENSLLLGWAPDQIIIRTNFDFCYKGVKTICLRDIEYRNAFFNKFYGLGELYGRGYLNGNCWYHDPDVFQLHPLVFPKFSADCGICRGVTPQRLSTASLYFKPEFASIVKTICKRLKENSLDYFVRLLSIAKQIISDEEIVNYWIKCDNEFSLKFSALDNQYNLGVTDLVRRYKSAQFPSYAIGFKPHISSDWLRVVKGKNKYGLKIIPTGLVQLMNKHRLSSSP